MFQLHEPLDDALRSKLARYDDLTATLLARRGLVTNEAAEKFLNPSYDMHLYDPFLMVDMRKAARRLIDAITSGERIAIWSDYDCDGIPGGVVLHDFLKKVGANFENYIPHRHEEGYGMNIIGIEKIVKQNGVRLIVTVDSGILDMEPIARANELGVDVIITDHHLPDVNLPKAFAIVNPHARPDETYPFKELCGAGVAWKLICAMLLEAPVLREEIPLGWEKWLLDMIGLATIADMVPLIDENRVLATYGLLVMRKSPRIGLQKLCRVMRINQRTITEDDVGFMIAPRVNAASRMGNARDAFRLFTTDNESEADELTKKLERANRQRKAEAGAITRTVHARLSKSKILKNVIALGDPEWRPALLGLVAGTIADEYERPVFLWGREGNMRFKGSVRSGGSTHVLELMRATHNTFIEFGGHAKAGGFTVHNDAIFFLEDRLVEAYARLVISETEDTLMKHADATITPDEATAIFLKRIEMFAPFGMQNSKPVFLLRAVLVENVSRFGKSKEHLKLRIHSPNGSGGIDAIAFFAKSAVANIAHTLDCNSHVNILVHVERDTFSHRSPVRLRLIDISLI